MKYADLDCIFGPSGQRRHEAKGQAGRGGKPAATSRSLSDRVYRVEHRVFLCKTRANGAAPSRTEEIARSGPMEGEGYVPVSPRGSREARVRRARVTPR